MELQVLQNSKMKQISKINEKRKCKKSKRKPEHKKPQQGQLSQAYQEREREVATLLEKREKHRNERKSNNNNNSNDSFYYTLNIPVPSSNISSTDNNETDNNNYANENANGTTSSAYTTVDLSFLDMAEDQLKPLVQRASLKIYIPNKDYIYRPTVVVDCICNPFACQILKNHERMLKRFQMEAQASKSNLSRDVINFFKSPPMPQEHFYKHFIKYHSTYEYNFKSVFIEPTAATIFIPCRKILTLYLKDLRFTKHPELTEEHELVNTLEMLYDSYNQRLMDNTIEQLEVNLQIERDILNEMLQRSNNKKNIGDGQQFLRLQEVSSNVKCLREKLYAEEATSKQLLKDILDNWLKLQQIRQNTQQQLTRQQFSVQIEQFEQAEVDKRKSLWAKRYKTDLEEIYREQYEEYYCSKRLWQQKSHNKNNNVHKTKPKKPNLEKVKRELSKIFARSFLKPEEPRVYIKRYLTDEQNFNQLKNSGPSNLHSYFLRIYLDRHEVGESKCYRLERDLYININEVIGIIINRSLPNKIYIKLYKKYNISLMKKLANIVIPLPLVPYTDINKHQSFSIDFSSEKMPIAGVLRLDISFNKTNYSSNNMDDNIIQRQKEEILRTNLNGKHYEQNNDAKEKDNLKGNNNCIMENQKTCTFEEYNLQFCDIQELLNNKRFKLLRSRYLKDDNRTCDLKCIPMLEHELQHTWEETEEIIDISTLIDPIDLHKHKAKKYLRSLYTALRNHSIKLCKDMESRENLLLNDYPLSWRSFFQAINVIFQPQKNRSFSGTCSSNTSVTNLTINNIYSINIICFLMRASGIPVRCKRFHKEDDSKNSKTGEANVLAIQNLTYTNVRPFITLSYKDSPQIVRSSTAEGSNPTWNEKLTLTVTGSLSELKDDIKLTLFDELVEQHYNEDDGDIYQKIQNNWLGELRIPINALLKERKLKGVFELQTPSILLGYNSYSLHNATNRIMDDYPEIKDCVYLWCSICLDPQHYELTTINTKCMNCVELIEIQNYLNNWSLEAEQICSQHFFNPLICTSEGKRICITRLLEPLKPPDNLNQGDPLVEACRFAFLLSVIKFYDPCLDLSGIWLKNEILLDTNWGSRKDIGVLLCNYLLHMGYKCWLILGCALGQDECAFILYETKQETDFFLIDPCCGKQYTLNDAFCPLQKVYMAVNTKHIYLNLQANLRVSMMSFTFNDNSCWLPVFNNKTRAPLGGFHSTNYSYRPSMNIHNLRINIERKIMKKINSWRLLRKTTWNRAFQPFLMNILQNLEYATMANTNAAEENLKYINSLEEVFPNYKIFGFTLNFAYTNLSQITERIKSTGLHLNTTRNIEFSVAVHIHPYVNNVLSVWIFLISIIPPNNDSE